MDNMDHAIEQAADILGAHPEAFNVTDYTDEQTTMITAPVEDIARALASAGLLAPAPLREEWGKRSLGWRRRTHTRPSFNEHDARNVGWDETTVRRYATDWLPVDRTEFDQEVDL